MMTIQYIISQIQTGISWIDYFANLFLVEYGAATTIVIIVLLVGFVVIRNQAEAKTGQTELINDIARKSSESERALNEKLLTSERSLGTLEGRIVELSGLVRHNQDKYELREKAWEKEQRELREQIAALTKQYNEQQSLIEKLQHELNGKNEKLAALETENKQLTTQNVNVQRDKLDLETERDRLQSLVNEQAAQIELLAKQLAEKDPPKAVTVTETPTTTVSTVTTVTENIKELNNSEKETPNE